MPADNYPGKTTGETRGPEQEPVNIGERDGSQQRQAEREGSPPLRDPRRPDVHEEDSLVARCPDEIYGREERESGTPRAGMPVTGAENLPQEE